MPRSLASILAAFVLLLALAAQVYADTQGEQPVQASTDRNLLLGVVVLGLLVASLVIVRPRRRG